MFFRSLVAAVLVALVAGATGTVLARSNGITGQYQNGCGGIGCHGGTATSSTELTLTGPGSLKAGATGNFTVRVANSTATVLGAGFNLAILSPANAVSGSFQAGNGISTTGTQLAHTQTKLFDANDGADFAFSWTAPNTHGVYTVAIAGNAVNGDGTNGGDIWNTKTVSISVNGATITAPTGGTYCQGGSVTLTWTQTGISNMRVEISSDNFTTVTTAVSSVAGDAGQFVYTIPTSLAPASTYRMRLVDASNGDVLATTNTFAISAGPSFVTQPENTEVCVGATAQIVAGANGSDVIYAWKKDGQTIAGATTGVLRIVGASADDAGTYVCEATSCNQTVTSNEVTLTVNTPPEITSQPVGDTVCQDQTVTLSVTATGSDLFYQWTRNGVDIDGANEPTLTLTGISIQQKGTYRCRVQGACPPAALSDGVTIEVITGPTINLQPRRANLTVGQDLVLSVTAAGVGLTYQWYRNGTAIAGATKAIYAKAAASKDDAGTYYVNVINECATVPSNEVEVTVSDVAGPGVFALAVEAIDLGNIPMCDVVDTTVAGLLQNTGGTAITVTGATITPAGAAEISGVTFPLTIEPGASTGADITFRASGAGAQSVTIEFTEAAGNLSMTVGANGQEVARSLADTVSFPVELGPTKCVTMAAVPCPSYQITAVTFEGAAAGSYTLADGVTLPIEGTSGQNVRVCITSVQDSDGEATVVLQTTAGDVRVALKRDGVLSSVEEDLTVIEGLQVSPNPMRDELMIRTASLQPLTVHVHSVVGNRVASFEGTGEVRWDGRDLSGARLAAGVYVLVIEQGLSTQVVKIIVE